MESHISERNEAGDRFDGSPNPPVADPPVPAPRVIPSDASGANEAGDPIFSVPPRSGDYNEAGDRYDGQLQAPPPGTSNLPPRGIPSDAIGMNEAGDPIFHHPTSGMNEAGDQSPSTAPQVAASAPAACGSCSGAGTKRYVDAKGMTATMACQDCEGLGFVK